ncbi:MAG: hypothetical protein M1377_01145 [Deltaproteobacteria bacterium]|nr:hypothetical protein [Deltaproteobacteria bacterium]
MIHWLMVISVLFIPAPAHAEWRDSIRVCFDASAAIWVSLPDGFPDSELDVLEDVDGRYKAVIIDLKNDGGRDYFFPSACGNGGCEYPVYDSRSRNAIGSVFGSPICIMKETANDFPVIQTYSHVSATSGTIARYVFDGKKYGAVSSVHVKGEEDEAISNKIGKAPYLKGEKR